MSYEVLGSMVARPQFDAGAACSVFAVAPNLRLPEPEPSPLSRLVLESDSMIKVARLVERIAGTSLTMTILGETGSGKDVLARLIHNLSPRSRGPFVVFDCGAVAANLAESELLGHERGSFTGAHGVHIGAFERAHGGTLFLDEIGELPLDLQPRLLRALENRQVRRVGGSTNRDIDVRVIAATNRDLRGEVQLRRFREDLYFRLAGALVILPSLRERKADIPRLSRRILNDLGAGGAELTPEALDLLTGHDWPGNVRELKNTLSCALALSGTQLIEAHHLHLQAKEAMRHSALRNLPLAGLPLAQIERVAIEQTLALVGGSKIRAAELLGMAVSTLYEKLKKFGLHG